MDRVAGTGDAAVRHGVPAPERVLIIACGALAREIKAVLVLGRLDHVALRCLPAVLHNRPESIPGAVEKAIRLGKREFDRIAVAYADCGTGGHLDRVLEREGVERLPGAHCYAFFTGTETFAAQADADMRALFLTDFLARHAESFLIRPLGLDRHPELRDAYFSNYEKVVYLAQTDDPVLTQRARETAEFLGLAFERRFTGYGMLEPFVKHNAGAAGQHPINDDQRSSQPVPKMPLPEHRTPDGLSMIAV